MKTLIVGQSVEPPFSEGGINVILNWSRALACLGSSVTVLSTSSKLSGHRKILGVDFEFVKTKRPRFQDNLFDLFSLQERSISLHEYDIMHFASNAQGYSYIPALLISKLRGNKIINSYLVNQFKKTTLIYGNLFFDRITLPSRRMFQTFSDHKLQQQKLRLIRPCVNEKEFFPRNKNELREKFGLSNSSFVVFTTGHFKRGRSLVPLIHSICNLVKRGQEIELLIGWTGHGEAESIAEIFLLAKKHKFLKIIPPTRNINLFYGASDIYVLSASSNYVIETPLSLIEALLSGTPAISFDVNASQEIIEDRVNGFILRKGDFSDLESKLGYLANDTSMLSSFSQKARELALKRYSYEIIGNQLLRLYNELYY
jgi:glycosyltransferase involved in cell wall biosynthesis